MVEKQRRELNDYQNFVKQIMPILSALEKEKPKELRRNTAQLMKVIGELWQNEKRNNFNIPIEHFNLLLRYNATVPKHHKLNDYQIFVKQIMPILSALEREKPKELRRHPAQLMKIIGELWQIKKLNNFNIPTEHFNLLLRYNAAAVA
jgi:uncharacterized protein YaaN involved in tellurite resistance